MNVKKRDGRTERVDLNKITKRLGTLINKSPKLSIDPIPIASKVVGGLYDGVTTRELDNLAAETSATMASIHPDYESLAARIEISNVHKETNANFAQNIEYLHSIGIISDKYNNYVQDSAEALNSMVESDRDFLFDYFGAKTLKRAYLLKDKKGKIIERPQHMWLRVASFIHMGDLEATKETYDLLSQKYFTHATPTLFNSGTVRPQLSSCFLLDIDSDSIGGIYKTLADCAKISQSAGGIGLAIHKIRSKGSYIAGTNGTSNGIVPMLRVFDTTARYVDQCFNGDTLVYTDIGAKPFKELTTSRRVVTNDGTLKDINKVVVHDVEEKDAIKLTLKKAIRPITVTNLHPFYTIKNQKIGINHSVIKNRLNKYFIAPEWVEAKDLTKDDLIGFPIPNNEIDNPSFSEEDCWLYGLLLGDGNMQYDSNNGFKVHLGSHETDLINRVQKYCADRGIKVEVTVNGTKTTVRGNSSENNPIKRKDLYSGGSKYFSPELQILPKKKSLAILQGLMDSDGHYGKKELLLELSDNNIIEGVRYMLLRLGILTSGYDRNRIGNTSSYKNITTRKTTICLRIPKEKLITDYLKIQDGKNTAQFVWNNIIWTRVSNVVPTKLSGKVYDLEVQDNHNYLTEIGLVHNGGGKRKGSIAAYIEPWHADIFEFLELKKNHGKEEMRARDLFYALWIPDLFMQRVEADGTWSLFDPKVQREYDKDLSECVGEEFKQRYEYLESKGVGTKIKARDLWDRIIESQIETGTPYMLYKDAANLKSNQQNLGTIKSSNLCAEIIEYTSPEEVAVCNLASISLPAFVNKSKNGVSYEKLYEVSKTITKNLNKVIDENYYPVPEAERSNTRHRPIGIGVQGLADLFAILKLDFDSEEAKKINKEIFETIYKGAVDASILLAKINGVYETYKGSPASNGRLQFDLWGLDRNDLFLDWTQTFKDLDAYGLRNSLLLAPMPTASTAQILGNNEAFEPFTSNIYLRRTLAGEFVVVNKHLIRELIELGIWNEELRQDIIKHNGSILGIETIPKGVRSRYRTVWELSMKTIIDMAADRGNFICQSQSMNLFVENITPQKLTSMHFYAWKKGLKTGMYYLRTQAARDAIKFTVPKSVEKVVPEPAMCLIDDPDCEACGA